MPCNRSLFALAAVAVMSFAFTVPSLADRKAADACAAKLSPDAKSVYAATIGSVKPGVDLTAAITEKTRGLVMSGKLSRGAARPAAEAAGTCLKRAAE